MSSLKNVVQIIQNSYRTVNEILHFCIGDGDDETRKTSFLWNIMMCMVRFRINSSNRHIVAKLNENLTAKLTLYIYEGMAW